MEKIRIFIAEDDADWRETLCDYLDNRPNLEIVGTAEDGEEACAKIPDIKPDVLILDICMPYLDGLEVLKRLRQMNIDKQPVVIVTSAIGQSKLMQTAMHYGATYCMVKPVDLGALTDRIIQFSGCVNTEPLIRVQPATQSIYESLTKPDTETEVTKVMHEIGVPAHIKGYQYVRTAIMMVIENGELINAVTKQLYPAVAKKFGTTNSRVERAIRHGIEVAFDRGDPEILSSYFGFTVHSERGKPTNSEFIAMISDRIRLQLKNA